jgi:hypothetical protein
LALKVKLDRREPLAIRGRPDRLARLVKPDRLVRLASGVFEAWLELPVCVGLPVRPGPKEKLARVDSLVNAVSVVYGA